MAEKKYQDNPAMRAAIYKLYREFFEQAERARRWTLHDDIPWEQSGQIVDPSVADVVESFCVVELYLPDYVGKMMPEIRDNRGRAWFAFNWGYEESKHSLALGDWLLKSGYRSDEEMTDLETGVFDHEWNLPQDDVRGMVTYSMVQELATWLNYRNLRQHIGTGSDPALHKLLGLIMVDERAHYSFFRKLLQLHLKEDREGTIEAMRDVLHNFAMPALGMLLDGRKRIAEVEEMGLFNEHIYFKDVYMPILDDLGVTRKEMRRKTPREQVVVP